VDQQNEERLKHKTGQASDLEAQFEEILSEFAEQAVHLFAHNELAHDFDIIKPEIQKTKQRLLDVVSNTIIMDPH
jgi:hypothetical protein